MLYVVFRPNGQYNIWETTESCHSSPFLVQNILIVINLPIRRKKHASSILHRNMWRSHLSSQTSFSSSVYAIFPFFWPRSGAHAIFRMSFLFFFGVVFDCRIAMLALFFGRSTRRVFHPWRRVLVRALQMWGHHSRSVDLYPVLLSVRFGQGPQFVWKRYCVI